MAIPVVEGWGTVYSDAPLATTDFAVDVPDGATTDDLLLTFIISDGNITHSRGTSNDFNATPIINNVQNTATLSVWWKIEDGSAPASYNFQLSAGEYAVAHMVRVSGANSTQPDTSGSNTGTSDTPVANGITTGEDDCMVFAVTGNDRARGTVSSVDNSFTNLLSTAGDGANGVGLHTAYLGVASGSTAVGNTTFSTLSASDGWIGAQISIAPGADPPTDVVSPAEETIELAALTPSITQADVDSNVLSPAIVAISLVSLSPSTTQVTASVDSTLEAISLVSLSPSIAQLTASVDSPSEETLDLAALTPSIVQADEDTNVLSPAEEAISLVDYSSTAQLTVNVVSPSEETLVVASYLSSVQADVDLHVVSPAVEAIALATLTPSIITTGGSTEITSPAEETIELAAFKSTVEAFEVQDGLTIIKRANRDEVLNYGNVARNAGVSIRPDLWPKLGGWYPTLGPTGTVLRDISGKGNDGVLRDPSSNFLGWNVDANGYAVEFQGDARAGFDLNEAITLNYNTQWTLSFAARADDLNESMVMGTAGTTVDYIWLREGTGIQIASSDGTGENFYVLSNESFVTYRPISFVCDGNGNIACYMDQVFEENEPVSTATALRLDCIGEGYDSLTYTLDGKIYWVHVTDSYLIPSQIADLHLDPLLPFRTLQPSPIYLTQPRIKPYIYNAGFPVDTGRAPDGYGDIARSKGESAEPGLWPDYAWVPSLGATGSTLKPIAGGIEGVWDGGAGEWTRWKGDLVVVSDADGGTEVSFVGLPADTGAMTIVHKFATASAAAGYEGIISRMDGNADGWEIGIDASSELFYATTQNWAINTTGDIITQGEYYQVAISVDPNVGAKIYLGGKLTASDSSTGAWNVVADIDLAARADVVTLHYKTYAGYVYYYRRALTPSQIAKLHRDPYAFLRRKKPIVHYVEDTRQAPAIITSVRPDEVLTYGDVVRSKGKSAEPDLWPDSLCVVPQLGATGTRLIDLSRGLDCIFNAGDEPTWGTDHLIFAGSEWVDIGTAADLNFGTGDFTFVVGWSTAATDLDVVFAGTNSPEELYLGINNGKARFGIRGAELASSNNYNDGGWHNLVFSRLGGVKYIYGDGKLDNSVADTGDASVADSMLLGAYNSSGLFGWEGKVRYFYAYPFALSPSQIAHLHRDPYCFLRPKHLIVNWPDEETRNLVVL